MNENLDYWLRRYRKKGGRRTVGQDSWSQETYDAVVEHFHEYVFGHHFAGRHFDDVLDFGCGIGRWTEGLASLSDRYFGVDIVEEVIDANAASDSRRFATIRDHEIPFPGVRFDLVFSCVVFQHVIDDDLLRHYAAQIRQRLTEKGRVFLVENLDCGTNDYMIRRSVERYIELFGECGLELIHLENYRFGGGGGNKHALLASAGW